jgi:hypothetical protein
MAESSLKNALSNLANLAAERGLPFLLVGGNAVILWGVPRFTRDIDFVITDEHRSAWHDLITSLGYKMFHKVDAFEQFECPGLPGIDLMLVHADTWGKLIPAARDVDLDQGAKAKIPDVLHLIAMKLNASRNPLRRSDAADIQDVIALIKVCTLDIRTEAFQAVLDRYASAEDRAKIEAIVPDHD